MVQKKKKRAVDHVCGGCVVTINGEIHAHVGSPIESASGQMIVTQDPRDDIPSVAALAAPDGVCVLMPPKFPANAVQAVMDEFVSKPPKGGNDLGLAARELYAAVRARLEVMVQRQELVRDYAGVWHWDKAS